MSVVLDASAILAVLRDEPGADVVVAQSRGASLSTVNLTEVITKLIDQELDLVWAMKQLARLEIEFVAFTADHAATASDLRPVTKACGLSLADRACLALAIERRQPVLTADRVWAELDLDVDIRLIR